MLREDDGHGPPAPSPKKLNEWPYTGRYLSLALEKVIDLLYKHYFQDMAEDMNGSVI